MAILDVTYHGLGNSIPPRGRMRDTAQQLDFTSTSVGGVGVTGAVQTESRTARVVTDANCRIRVAPSSESDPTVTVANSQLLTAEMIIDDVLIDPDHRLVVARV